MAANLRKTNKCYRCGAEIEPGSRYCMECGAPLKKPHGNGTRNTFTPSMEMV